MTDRLQAMVDELARNDVASAVAVAQTIAEELGAIPGGVMYYLWMLQDEPDELVDRLEGLPVTQDPHAI